MDSVAGTNATVVLRNVDVRMLVKALEQQKMLGAAEQRLVESAAPPPRPCEDGKGCAVDVVA
ncbi:MAG: hypothetical protein RL398_285 [Planctomycetota bacterium]|jgi:hypothetical protein